MAYSSERRSCKSDSVEDGATSKDRVLPLCDTVICMVADIDIYKVVAVCGKEKKERVELCVNE